ncbi:MAG TPA: hypothetical protein VIT22_13720, partial [Pseudoxanthomonas sp.]
MSVSRMRTKNLLLTLGAMTSLIALSACARSPELAAAPAAAPTEAKPANDAAATAALTPTPVATAMDPSLPLVVVHKNESCGCCVLWV